MNTTIVDGIIPARSAAGEKEPWAAAASLMIASGVDLRTVAGR